MGQKRVVAVLIFFSILIPQVGSGQSGGDSLQVISIAKDSVMLSSSGEVEEVIDTLENRPNTAALYSAALPGLGQAYNGKAWKIPIVYGAGLVIGYYINYNNQLYKQYRDGFIALTDGDDRTPYDTRLDRDDYQRQIDYWRRNRDLLLLSAVLVYLLNIVDAHVDAHMLLFTTEDDISLKLEPSISQTTMQTNLIGLSLKLRFN